jgi:hypothetical protein
MKRKKLRTTKEILAIFKTPGGVRLISGREKAKIITENNYRIKYRGIKGILTHSEINDVLCKAEFFEDADDIRDFNECINIFDKFKALESEFEARYYRFKCSYERLRKWGLLFKIYPAVNYLAKMIKKTIKHKRLSETLLTITKIMTDIKINDDEKTLSDDVIRLLMEEVFNTYKNACEFAGVSQIIDDINKRCGFAIRKSFADTHRRLTKDVAESIKKYNDFAEKELLIIKHVEDKKTRELFIIPRLRHTTENYVKLTAYFRTLRTDD